MTGPRPAGGPWGPWKARLYALTHRRSTSNLWVVDHADLRRSDRVLDIGCGPGVAICAAADRVEHVAGVDPTPELVKVARWRCRSHQNAEIHEGDSSALPFGDATFTLVWTIASLHHWPERTEGLSEAYRVLAARGRILIAEWATTGSHGHGLSEHETVDVIRELKTVGFAGAAAEKVRIGARVMVVIRAYA